MEGRFERVLPPEHRIRARRADHPDGQVELIVEGPMLPVVDGEFDHGFPYFTAFDETETVRLEACWHVLDAKAGVCSVSESWVVGEWPSYAAMMDFLR
jgi:hypothetical protein